ncbi:MAG: hypothetical protein C4519_19145 [Desulfobacteraceae bacterium]|nr:MAG: hypothetical protein C4519_19145 [Desulfobacteraceae bacterium]
MGLLVIWHDQGPKGPANQNLIGSGQQSYASLIDLCDQPFIADGDKGHRRCLVQLEELVA